MKKVCILSTVNLKHMTLVSLYTDFLEKNLIEYDIVYIDKYGEKEETAAKNVYTYRLNIERGWSKYRKAIKYWGFRSFANAILKNRQYDFIITWNALTAFMFQGLLSKLYKGRYCLNIRDISTNPIINRQLKKAVTNAAFSTVSSAGFVPYLPKGDYIEIHSLNMKILRDCLPHNALKTSDEPLVITYIGYMSYIHNCYKLIEALGNDGRYHMNFFGQGSDVIQEYCMNNRINNVTCVGRFEPSKTASLIQDSDIIYNLYGVENINVRTALSIKLYYAAFLNVPILVFKDTFMAEVSERYHFGYSMTTNGFDSLADELHKWYHQQSQSQISGGCIKLIEEAKNSNTALTEKMRKYLLA